MEQTTGDVYVATGITGELAVTPTTVTIRRRGVRSFLARGMGGEKEIRIDQITAVEFRRATRLLNGFIQFSFQGGREVASGVGQAARDENAVFFSYKQMPAFERAKELIDRYRAAAAPSAPDVYDQLRRLAELRDAGVLTEAEFEDRKRALLARI